MQVIERLSNDMPTQYWSDEEMTELVTMERAVAMVEVWNIFLPKLDLGQLELALRSSIPWDLRAEKPHFQVYVQYTDPCHTSTRVNMFPFLSPISVVHLCSVGLEAKTAYGFRSGPVNHRKGDSPCHTQIELMSNTLYNPFIFFSGVDVDEQKAIGIQTADEAGKGGGDAHQGTEETKA